MERLIKLFLCFALLIVLPQGAFAQSTPEPRITAVDVSCEPRGTSVGSVLGGLFFTGISVYLTKSVPEYVIKSGMEKGWQLRGYRDNGRLTEVVYNNHGLPTEATILGLEEDRCTIQDWITLLESFGLRGLNQPKAVTATNEEGFNIKGLKLDFVTDEDKVLEAITIYLPKLV